MNRKERVRTASDHAKETVRNAAEVVGPYAASAKDSATRCAQDAERYLRPHARRAADEARKTYDAHLAPRVEQAWQALPDGVEEAAGKAAVRTRKAARKAREAAGPRLEAARAAAGPARERSAAAVAALRSDLTVKEVRRAVRRRERRARAWSATKWVGAAGLVAGGAYAVWKWWDRQANPDWLVEPPAATEVGDGGLAAEERSDALRDPELDPETAAGQTAEEATEEERQPEGDDKR